MIKTFTNAKKINLVVLGEPNCGKTDCVATLLGRAPDYRQNLIPGFDYFTMSKRQEVIEVAVYEANFKNADFLLNANIMTADFLMDAMFIVIIPYDRESFDYDNIAATFDKLNSLIERAC